MKDINSKFYSSPKVLFVLDVLSSPILDGTITIIGEEPQGDLPPTPEEEEG